MLSRHIKKAPQELRGEADSAVHMNDRLALPGHRPYGILSEGHDPVGAIDRWMTMRCAGRDGNGPVVTLRAITLPKSYLLNFQTLPIRTAGESSGFVKYVDTVHGPNAGQGRLISQ